MRRFNGLSDLTIGEKTAAAQIFFVLAVTACNGKTSTPDPADSPTEDTVITPVGQVSEGAFYVEPILPEKISYYFHRQSGFSDKCQIATSETDVAKKDIFCILDIQELDLYHRDLKLNFNSPSTLCSYVRVRPYWFYDFEPSPGYITRTATTLDGVVTAQPAQGDVTISGDGSVNWCKYDHSLSENPNCCEGEITVTVGVTDTTVTPPVVNSTTTTTSLGGKMSSCVQGPGLDFKTSTKSGYPVAVDYPAGGTGINDVLALNKPAEKERPGNLYLANFFSLTATSEFPAATGDIPTAITGPTGARSGNPYYEFDCLDQADDYIARIRILIRSWDTITGFTEQNNPYTSSGTEPQYSGSWHDRSVWKDVGSDYPSGV